MTPRPLELTGKFKLPSSVMEPAEKFPLPSRLTMVLTVSALVAESPSVTAPPAVEAVMSSLPLTESTPVLCRVVESPRATAPPPPRPAPALMVTELLANWLLPKGPFNCAALTVPDRLLDVLAKMAYGAGVNCWRGSSETKLLPPLVCTSRCSQLLPPRNAPGPKSTSIVNNPLLTATAVLVIGPTITLPPVSASYTCILKS